MSADLLTAVGLPVLGVGLTLFGWWGRERIDLLVGTIGVPEVLERRRLTMARGALACIASGVVLLIGGIALGIVAMG